MSRSAKPETIRVGIVGLGRWGRNLIREFSRACEVTMCVNRGDEEAIGWLARNYPRVQHTTDVTALLESDVQAVVVATPIETHVDLALRALEAGKHVFVEKPLATTVKACSEVVAAANRSRRALAVGYVFLYDDALVDLYVRTQEDPVRRLQMAWHKFGTFEEPLTWNLLSHEVAIALWLTRSLPESHSVDQADGSRTSLDLLHAELRFRDSTASIEIDRTSARKQKTVLATTLSGARYLWRDGSLAGGATDDHWNLIHAPTTAPLQNEVQMFLDAVRTGADPRTGPRFGCLVTSVVADLVQTIDLRRPPPH